MKVLIIGSVASGKSTLARKLSNKSNIKSYEIDSIVHDDVNNIKRKNEEQQKIIKKIDNQNEWIIEGTLRRNLYNLLEMADNIIYVDTPLIIRKKRILTRYIKQKLGIEKCGYKPSYKMLKNMYTWTKEFESKRKDFEDILKKYQEKVIVVKNSNDIHEDYIMKRRML